ncbi:diguanylate cyclase (GGDEF) domain-containing protein [Pseudomonas sp. HPB0071]|uniref:diguanylate cyclase n=1 Tax=Pseudomonas luteola TaxID=47886 RepID=A0A2X2CYD9_PSELU|nr:MULTISPECIES: GGDEF domain-containing protein [Pseudomonas]ENA32638.1 diguanylate cyclase (GGDEF) domain-containing protein [Pseudomonas sp. HPB0071]SPZ13068.1 diguanylate cyclase [Pseudomonas luteola]
MSQDDLERWKNKYLEVVERQEEVEARWEARLDLVRRGLTRTSIAAEGNDKAVDECLHDLRNILRHENMDDELSRMIPRLEKTVLESERRRSERAEHAAKAFADLSHMLMALPLPRDIRKSLKRFAKKAANSAEQPGDFPKLVIELSRLQRQALEAQANAQPHKPGFLERLLGKGKEEAPVVAKPVPAPHDEADDEDDLEDEPASNAADLPVVAEPATPEQVVLPVAETPQPSPITVPIEGASSAGEQEPLAKPIAQAEPIAAIAPDVPSETPASTPVEAEADKLEVAEPTETAIETATVEDEKPAELEAAVEEPSQVMESTEAEQSKMATAEVTSDESHFDLPPPPEPGYSAIAPHIEATLIHLLDELQLPDSHKPQAEALRQRMFGRLNWYELVPLLDDLSGLVLSLNDQGHREFEGYLKQLNQRLDSFQNHLQQVNEGHDEAREQERSFSEELREQVSDLQTHVQEAAEPDNVKKALESRLDGMLTHMEQYQQQREARELEMAERLKTLSERVVSMEQEANDYRSHVEEQRKKALTDPLTGLPNRAAWTERLDAEVSLWQRYHSSLLLAVIDVDHFKRVNDDFGHLAGDKVLKIIGTQLSKKLRRTDFIARFGGEEFVVLLPNTSMEEGEPLIQALRAAIEACPFHFKGERVTITCSAGLTAFQTGEGSKQAFERADQALYRAKRGGRNRIELA